MRTILFSIALIAALASCSQEGGNENGKSAKGEGKYPLRSAVITYEAALPQNMGSNTRTLYFDDYGDKEKTVTLTSISAMGQSMNTETHTIITDGYVYSWTPGESTGTKIKLEEGFNPKNMNYDELSDEMKEQMNLVEEGKEKFMDKNCDVYSMDMEGVSGKVWVWENLPLKIQASAMGMIMTEKATNIDENADIPSGTFDLPDLNWTDVSDYAGGGVPGF